MKSFVNIECLIQSGIGNFIPFMHTVPKWSHFKNYAAFADLTMLCLSIVNFEQVNVAWLAQ